MDAKKIAHLLRQLADCFDTNDPVILESQPVPNTVMQAVVPTLSKAEELLQLPGWPAAVDPDLICDIESDDELFARARNILNFLVPEPFQGKRFLDFGCGHGHSVREAKSLGTAVAVGYDFAKQGRLEWESDPVITTDFEKVRQNGPYDIILLYDVIDNVVNATPVDILRRCKELLSSHGRMYVRCHPSCSRHGGNHYRTYNKAYLQVVLKPEELESLGIKHNSQKVIYPLATYADYFRQVGLKVLREDVERQPVESFFKQEDIRKRVREYWDHRLKQEFPDWQMEQCFIDYVLTHA